MKADLYTAEGAKAKSQVDLDDSIFNQEPNEHLVYQAVVTEMANARIGSHSAKTRAEKRGGGRKPWRQKGTGRARSGSTRSPIWTGGGVTFAPKPHDYKKSMNKKAKRRARRSAFSYRAKEGQVYVIKDVEFAEPKTKRLATLLTDMELVEKKVLFLTGGFEGNLYLSARNLGNIAMMEAEYASTYDILDCEAVVITEAGLAKLTQSLGNEKN